MIQRIKVVLPAPLGPNKTKSWPFAISVFTPDKALTGLGLEGNVTDKLRALTTDTYPATNMDSINRSGTLTDEKESEYSLERPRIARSISK